MIFVGRGDRRLNASSPRQARAHRRARRSRSTGVSRWPEACRRQLGDLVVCPDVAAAEGTPIADAAGARALHWSATTTRHDDGRDARPPGAARWARWDTVDASLRSRDEAAEEARRLGPFRAARAEAASVVTSFNYAFEGIIYVVRTQRNMRVHFAVALGVLPVGVLLGRDPVRAAGGDAGGVVRADRRDDQHRAREGDRRRHQLVRPAGPRGQGRRCRGRAGRRRERRLRRVPGVRRAASRSQPARPGLGPRLAGAPDRDRHRGGDDDRDRSQGRHPARHAALRRAAVGACGRGVRRLGRSHAGDRRLPATRCWCRRWSS